jgi:hypothetical protein
MSQRTLFPGSSPAPHSGDRCSRFGRSSLLLRSSRRPRGWQAESQLDERRHALSRFSTAGAGWFRSVASLGSGSPGAQPAVMPSAASGSLVRPGNGRGPAPTSRTIQRHFCATAGGPAKRFASALSRSESLRQCFSKKGTICRVCYSPPARCRGGRNARIETGDGFGSVLPARFRIGTPGRNLACDSWSPIARQLRRCLEISAAGLHLEDPLH